MPKPIPKPAPIDLASPKSIMSQQITDGDTEARESKLEKD